MTQKVLSIKVEPSDFTRFKTFAKGYKTQAEAFAALMQLTSILGYTSETQSQSEGIPKVCVLALGDKLPPQYELQPHKTEVISMSYKGYKRDWYVFPEDRVVAIWKKSANGSQSWLEVAAQFPEAVWLAAIKHSTFASNPLSTLREYQAKYDRIAQFDSQPIIAEAIAKGWDRDWQYLDGSYLERLEMNKAQEYLNNLPLPVAESVTISMTDLAARLTPKWLAKSGAKTDETKAKVVETLSNTLKTKSANKCPIWTAEYDSEGLSWQPDGADREQWVSCGK